MDQCNLKGESSMTLGAAGSAKKTKHWVMGAVLLIKRCTCSTCLAICPWRSISDRLFYCHLSFTTDLEQIMRHSLAE